MTLGNDNGTDGQTDGQTDRRTDRVRRNMRPLPREEGRIISCYAVGPSQYDIKFGRSNEFLQHQLRPHRKGTASQKILVPPICALMHEKQQPNFAW